MNARDAQRAILATVEALMFGTVSANDLAELFDSVDQAGIDLRAAFPDGSVQELATETASWVLERSTTGADRIREACRRLRSRDLANEIKLL